MVTNLLIFVASLLLLVKCATFSTKYASLLAGSFKLSKYVVGFLVVAVISILPETFIAIHASLDNIPAFGLGTLFGSNVADLTLVFVLLVLLTGREIKIESKILKNNGAYPFILLLPIILGLDGSYSRFEGLALITTGLLFYFISFKNGVSPDAKVTHQADRFKNLLLLLASMAGLLAGAHFTVEAATALAQELNVNPILIGMLVVGVGTTMPELFFSLKAIRARHDSLAVGDILGTVLADATVVVGILAIMNPFSFPQKIIYVTGVFMVLAGAALFYYMRTGKVISKKEAVAMLLFYLAFILTELAVNK